jgi:hypothetical protein
VTSNARSAATAGGRSATLRTPARASAGAIGSLGSENSVEATVSVATASLRIVTCVIPAASRPHTRVRPPPVRVTLASFDVAVEDHVAI